MKPTEDQKKAGNYPMKHVRVGGRMEESMKEPVREFSVIRHAEELSKLRKSKPWLFKKAVITAADRANAATPAEASAWSLGLRRQLGMVKSKALTRGCAGMHELSLAKIARQGCLAGHAGSVRSLRKREFQSYAKTPQEERAHLGRALLIGGGLALGGAGIGAGLRAGMMSGAVRTSEKLRGVIRGMRQARSEASAAAAAGRAAGVDASIAGDQMRRASRAAKANQAATDAKTAKKAGKEFFKTRAAYMTPQERAAVRGKKGFVFREPPKSGITGEIPIPENKGPRVVRKKVQKSEVGGQRSETPAAPVQTEAEKKAARMAAIRAAVARTKDLSRVLPEGCAAGSRAKHAGSVRSLVRAGAPRYFAEQTVQVVRQKRDGLSKARDAAQLAAGVGVLGLAGYGGFRVHGLFKQAAKHIPGIAAEVKKAVPKVAKVAEDTMGATKAAADNVTKQADNIGHSTAIYSDIGRIYKAAKSAVAGGAYNIIHPRQTLRETRGAFRAGLRGEKTYPKVKRPAWALSRNGKGKMGNVKFFEKEPLSWKRKAGIAAGVGVAGVGASLMPAAASMMKIPGRKIFGSARQAAVAHARRLPGLRGIKSPVADVHAGGRMVSDYLDASQAAMNRGLHGKIVGAVLHHAKKNPNGFIAKKIGGDFKVSHYARFRAGHKQALDHWDWEVGELYKERSKGVPNPKSKSGGRKKAWEPGKLEGEQAAMEKGRSAAHAEINARMYDRGDSEAEAIRHVATNTQSAHVRDYFDRLSVTKEKVAGGYAKQALAAPGMVVAGSAGAVASAKAGRGEKRKAESGNRKAFAAKRPMNDSEYLGNLFKDPSMVSRRDKREALRWIRNHPEARPTRKEFVVREEDGIPYSGKVAKDRYIKKIHDSDLDRRDANILRAGAAGAAAGALVRGGAGLSWVHPGKAALVGAGLGAAGVLGIRQITKARRDPYGERTRASKRAESVPWIAGAGAAGYLGGKRLRLFNAKFGMRNLEFRKAKARGLSFRIPHSKFHIFAEGKRKLPASLKAGISAAASGAALGLVPAFRRGIGFKTVMKSVAGGAAGGAALGGGGTFVGSRILGEPKKDENMPIMKRAALGGAIVGTAAGVGAGILAHNTLIGRQTMRGLAKAWRPAHWARKSGVLGASTIGAVAGGGMGAMHAADEGQQVDTLNALKRDKKTKLFQTAPAGVTPAGQWRKENQPRDRRNFFRTVGGVAAAGGIGYMAYRAGKAKVAGDAWRKVNAANADARAARDSAHARAARDSARRSARSAGAGSSRGGFGGTDWEDFFNGFRQRYGTAGGNGSHGSYGNASGGASHAGYTPPPRSNARGTGADRNPHFGTPKADKWDKWRSMRRMAEESTESGERDAAARAADAWKVKHNLKRRLKAEKSFWRPAGMPDVPHAGSVRSRLKRFDAVAADMGWDVRDPRGKSARVFAPGSRRRERRDAEWHETKDGQRRILIGAGVLGALAVGAGGVYAGKLWGRGAERLAQLRRVKAAAASKVPPNVIHPDWKTAMGA